MSKPILVLGILALCVGGVFTFFILYEPPVVVRIVNHSGVTLHNVQIHWLGEGVDQLPSGETYSHSFVPETDLAVEISFLEGPERDVREPGAYVSGGYSGTLTFIIDAAFDVVLQDESQISR